MNIHLEITVKHLCKMNDLIIASSHPEKFQTLDSLKIITGITEFEVSRVTSTLCNEILLPVLSVGCFSSLIQQCWWKRFEHLAPSDQMQKVQNIVSISMIWLHNGYSVNACTLTSDCTGIGNLQSKTLTLNWRNTMQQFAIRIELHDFFDC